MTITANEWTRAERVAALVHLENEMAQFHKLNSTEPIYKTVIIIAPSGYSTIVTDRFAKWFVHRNNDWTIKEHADVAL